MRHQYLYGDKQQPAVIEGAALDLAHEVLRYDHVADLPPLDSDPQQRRNVGLFRAMLYDGQWRTILEGYAQRQLGTDRAKLWGGLDTSLNLFSSFTDAISTLYDQPVTLRHPQPEAVQRIKALHLRGGRAAVAPIVQRRANALREVLLRVTYDGGARALVWRTVDPHLVEVYGSEENAARPAYVREPVWRQLRGGGAGWTWDVWDIRDPDWPVLRVENSQREDLTAHYLREPRLWSGRRYPYRISGRPVLPYTLYHAQKHGGLFAPWSRLELLDAALRAALYRSAWGHALLRAAWTQRVVLNGEIRGGVIAADVEGGAEAAYEQVALDPTAVAQVMGVNGQPASIDAWDPPVDLKVFQESVDAYLRALQVDYGIFTLDSRGGGKAESGVALQVSRENRQAIERRQAPLFADGDRQAISADCAVWAAHTGEVIPGDAEDWTVQYAYTERDPKERLAMVELLNAEVAAGLETRVGAYSRLNNVSMEDAILEIARMDAANQIAAPAEPAAPAPPAPLDADPLPADHRGTALVSVVLDAAGLATWTDLEAKAAAVVGPLEGYEVGSKMSDPPHVTVLYLGEMDAAQQPRLVEEVRATADALTGDRIGLQRVTAFPSKDGRHPIVAEVWCSAFDRAHHGLLHRLADIVQAPQHYPYRAHVTLGFASGVSAEELLALEEIGSGKDSALTFGAAPALSVFVDGELVEAVRLAPPPDPLVVADADALIAELVAWLASTGATVEDAPDLDPTRHAETEYATGTIRMQPALSGGKRLAVLAHEAGHWLAHRLLLGDQPDASKDREGLAYGLGGQILDRLDAHEVVDAATYSGLHGLELVPIVPPEANELLSGLRRA